MAGIKVHGLRELDRALEKLADDAGTMSEGHRAVASILVPAVAQRTPRRTGELALSWEPASIDGAAQVGSPLRYAGPVEFGTRTMEGARMVRDTLEAEEGRIIDGYEHELSRMGERAGFGT